MNKSVIGSIRKVKVTKKKTDGFIVADENEEYFLPHDLTEEENFDQDQEIDVFIYENRDKKIVATTTIPEITLESYGWAEVEEVVPHLGAFVNIGLDKAFLVSKDHMPSLKSVWPKEGDALFVSLEKDKKGRIFAEPITEGEVQEDIISAPSSMLHQEVIARVYRSTKAGSFILTGEGYRGFIHPNERIEEPRLGEQVEGRVIDVKEDGTINISLRPLKQEAMGEDAVNIYNYLIENDGIMNFTDKSDPDEIRETFQISKAAFKRAIGRLLKEKKIIQENGQTRINHND
ncbi:CvfB family protein [Halobacillus massiliensis]|uniref:CvfB family protein n=1 Tax=Halobacillus massiliensis TaxID=1926286 RepID=UPI0009E539F8|nr:S1-like domain-containing RNA-binding protein [Halobacillus massiliensis]